MSTPERRADYQPEKYDDAGRERTDFQPALYPDTPRPPMTLSEPVLTALEQMRLFARHDESCAFAVDLSGLNGDERAERPAPCSCGFDHALALYDVVVAPGSRFNHLLGIEAAAREEMRTRDIARAVAGRHVDAGHPYTHEMPDLEAATEIATRAEDALRVALYDGAAQSPVQPVLSGLDEAWDEALAMADQQEMWIAEHVQGRIVGGSIRANIERLRARLATAPAADEGPDRSPLTRSVSELDELVRNANEAYNAAISDALQVLQDMPGIVDNDGSQPRPEPDYIERAESVTEVEKLRR